MWSPPSYTSSTKSRSSLSSFIIMKTKRRQKRSGRRLANSSGKGFTTLWISTWLPMPKDAPLDSRILTRCLSVAAQRSIIATCGTSTSATTSMPRKYHTTGAFRWSKGTLTMRVQLMALRWSWLLDDDGPWEVQGSMQEALMTKEMSQTNASSNN